MLTESLIRITVFANRNEKLSETEFNNHWANEHAAICAPWLKRHGCIKYTQYHTTTPHKARLNLPVLSYDGMADFWYAKYEDFEKAYEDEYYLDVVKKDEEYLFDVKSIMMTAGVDICVLESGNIVEAHSRRF